MGPSFSLPYELLSNSRSCVRVYIGCLPGLGSLYTKTICDAGAELGVDVGPVLDHALLDGVADAVARVRDDVRDEVVAVGVVHDVAVESARLDEVVVLRVPGVGVAGDLPGLGVPGGVLVALGVCLRSTIAVRRVDRLVPVVMVAHRAVLVVVMRLVER